MFLLIDTDKEIYYSLESLMDLFSLKYSVKDIIH